MAHRNSLARSFWFLGTLLILGCGDFNSGTVGTGNRGFDAAPATAGDVGITGDVGTMDDVGTTGDAGIVNPGSVDAANSVPADLAIPCGGACGGANPFCLNDRCVPCVANNDCGPGKICQPMAGANACVSGCQTVAECMGLGGNGDSYECCAGTCLDVTIDPSNCGGCGDACGAGLLCAAGACTCAPCNFPNALGSCQNLLCHLDSCAPGYGDCNHIQVDGCETPLLNDSNNCGACGNICTGSPSLCVNGKCTVNSVLIVYSDAGNKFEPTIYSTIVGTKAFAKVDQFDASKNTPSVATMLGYGAVFVWNDPIFGNASQLGNNLADYWDQGGTVVVAVFSNIVLGVSGRFGQPQNGYIFIDPFGGSSNSGDHLGTFLPTHPLMTGVNVIKANLAYRSVANPINGGVRIASWAGGAPLVLLGQKSGRNIVSLNLFPFPATVLEPDHIQGDLAPLLRNALLYR